MATPSSPNAVCEPPFAFPQPARGAAKRPARSVAAPPDRYRRTGSARTALAERPRPFSPWEAGFSVGLVLGAAGSAWNGSAVAGGTRAPHGSVPAPSQRWEPIVPRLPRGMLPVFSVLHRAWRPSPNLLCQGRCQGRCQGHAPCKHSPVPHPAIALRGHGQERCKAKGWARPETPKPRK